MTVPFIFFNKKKEEQIKGSIYFDWLYTDNFESGIIWKGLNAGNLNYVRHLIYYILNVDDNEV